MSLFSIDGVTYPSVYVMEIKRKGTILDGPNTERTMQGEMVRDIIGTYYNYDVSIDCDDMSAKDYDAMYEVISAPVAYHNMVMPYGQSTLAFRAYITNVDDSLLYSENGHNRWGKLSFSMIAMSPKRRP